jgi:hypothetical protein
MAPIRDPSIRYRVTLRWIIYVLALVCVIVIGNRLGFTSIGPVLGAIVGAFVPIVVLALIGAFRRDSQSTDPADNENSSWCYQAVDPRESSVLHFARGRKSRNLD